MWTSLLRYGLLESACGSTLNGSELHRIDVGSGRNAKRGYLRSFDGRGSRGEGAAIEPEACTAWYMTVVVIRASVESEWIWEVGRQRRESRNAKAVPIYG